MSDKINYIFEEGIVAKQTAAEKAMLEEFKNGDYTIENPLVKLNPYIICPCAAVVLFRTEKETAVTITVHGKEPEGTMLHTFPKAKEHILPVLGLYPDYENTVDIELYRSKTKTIKIQTEPMSKDVPQLVHMKTTPGYLQDNLIFVSPALSDLATGFDYKGDVRWHINIPTVFDMKRLKNGHILTGTHRVLKLPYYMSGLYEMDFVGKIYKEYSIPGGYHHDQIEMPNGDLLVLTEDLTSDTVEDMCVLIDRETGEIKKTWDYKTFLTPGDGKSGSWSDHDWFHNNAVWYDENTNSLTLSGRHIDSMVNIDFETGKLNWIIGDPEGWPEEKQKYFFRPIGDKEFDWQYEQHANLITPNGDVMCFDNGHWRAKTKEKYLLNKDNFSRGVRYKINTDDMTIEQVWQYGKERGAEFFSQYICNVEYYEEGHYMVHSGGIQYYDGVASEKFVATMQGDPKAASESITVEVLNDQVMLELKVKGNFYRAEKLRLYHNFSNLELGEGKRLGKMGVTKEFDTLIPMDSCGELMPEDCHAHFIEEEDRFTLKSRFEKGQLVMLMLENDKEEHGYYISTAANQYSALCCGTFIESDERNTSTSINKAGLSGTYDVRVIIDDKKYETGIQITC